MFDETEVRLGFGPPVLLVRRTAVDRPSRGGPAQLRRHGKVITVDSHRVKAITPALAGSLARELLRPGRAHGLGFWLISDLTTQHGFHGRQSALEQMLTDSYLIIEPEQRHGRWEGRVAETRREEPEPEIRMKPLTWVAVTVVDEDEPARPLTGLGFKMRLPDGSTRAGALDDQGHVRVDDIEPGRCWVELTDLRRGFAS